MKQQQWSVSGKGVAGIGESRDAFKYITLVLERAVISREGLETMIGTSTCQLITGS